ncbi:MAG: glycosyltransferase family 2 protein [Acidobacteria bacterium]|nr:glycosyltransferase family 2 protein [Acidobacteriota bacterium]
MNKAESYQYAITVFTPTYNRAHTLHRVYESLVKQTYTLFEWIIVDDGSTDETAAIIDKWKTEADFTIRYFWQENQGKHIAINQGVKEARGELFMIFDSDDACTNDAVERIVYTWESISKLERHYFAGIGTLCVDQYGKEISPRLPSKVFDATWLEVNYRYGVGGEKWGIFRTELLRKNPFPAEIKKQYIPESIIWLRIGKKLKTRFINEALRIYYIEGPSMVHEVGATKNALGGALEHAEILNSYIAYIKYRPLEFIRSAVHYGRFSMHRKVSLLAQYRGLRNTLGKFLWFIALPISLTVYLRDKASK